MKISVVLTTYNGDRYIMEQLESLKNQSRKADEILIFDDCSTDQTINIIKNYILLNDLDNWVFTINNVNIGWRKNFMQGIWMATGDIVFTCDQDDIWENTKIEIMEKYMENNKNILLLTSRYSEFNEEGWNHINTKCFSSDLIEQKLVKNILNVKYPGNTYCIRKELILKTKNVWFEETPHDAFFWRIAILEHSLYTCNQILVRVRKHNSTFRLESKDLRNINKRIEWLNYAEKSIDQLNVYVKKNNIKLLKKEKKILDRNKLWVKLRREMLESKSILSWLLLAKYISCYLKLHQYFFDLLLIVKNKKRNK